MMGSLAWHGMGLGKTLEGLWLARHQMALCRQQGVVAPKFMVILPKSAIPAWKKECYEETPDLLNHMVIYPYSQLHQAIKYLKYVDIRFLIFDEVHYLKSPETDRIERLADFLRELQRQPGAFKFGRIFTGTGTPAPNNASEYYVNWALCCAPDLNAAADRIMDKQRFADWRGTFANEEFINFAIAKGKPHERRGCATKWEGVKNAEMLAELLLQFVHFRRVKDCIKLPPRNEYTVNLGFSDDSLLKDASIDKPDYYMSLVERLAKAKTPHMINWVNHFIHRQINQQLMVFALNRHPIETLESSFPGRVRLITGAESNTERAKNLKDFQDRKFQIMGLTYASGSESLNCQNAQNSLYCGWPWHDGKLKQAIARTDRQGQLLPTNHYFLTSGENDSRVLQNIREKEESTNCIEELLLRGMKKKTRFDLLI